VKTPGHIQPMRGGSRTRSNIRRLEVLMTLTITLARRYSICSACGCTKSSTSACGINYRSG